MTEGKKLGVAFLIGALSCIAGPACDRCPTSLSGTVPDGVLELEAGGEAFTDFDGSLNGTIEVDGSRIVIEFRGPRATYELL